MADEVRRDARDDAYDGRAHEPGDPAWWAEAAFTCSRFARHAYHLAGLPPSSAPLRVLGMLRRRGPMRITAIAERERSTQPTASALVARMRGEGLVDVVRDPDDGRATLVAITDAGREHLASFGDAVADGLSAALVDVTAEERDAVAAALPVLRRLVEADAAGPRPGGANHMNDTRRPRMTREGRR